MLKNATGQIFNVNRDINTYLLFKDSIANGFINNKPYQITTNATDELVNKFLNHINANEALIITSDNIGSLRSLNDELCKKRIAILYDRRSNALYNIGILKHSSHAINEVDIQMIIANDFDFYLENVYDDLFQIQLEVLIKIIQAANFTNHNLAFQVILRYGEQNSNYFSLIRYLDIKLLSEENLNDIFRNSDKYSGITPIRNRKDIFVTTSGKQTIRCVTEICIGFLSGSIFVHILHKRK